MLASLTLIAALQGLAAAASDVVALPLPPRSHARDLQKRAEVDCGTFTMFCGGVPKPDGGRLASIEDACNNACYFVNVLNGGSYIATYRPENDNNQHNRRHSGCNVGSSDHSVCTYMPFSQKLGVDHMSTPSCDEFPMADWVQPDFGSTDGPRNALRCMEQGVNSAAGNQWSNFKDNTGDGLEGRTCAGAMDDPNTDYKFNIAFNLDETAISEVGFCDDPSATLDFQEFFMTSKGATHGSNHFPMRTDDSQYSITDGTAQKTLEQCKVVVTRTAGDNYNAAITDMRGEEIGSVQGGLNEDGARLTIVPPEDKSLGRLHIIRTGQMGTGGTVGSRVDFEFRAHEDDDTSWPLIDFGWTTEDTGVDRRFQEDGKYCEVPNIEELENGPSQTITCYYPCPRP